MKSAKSSGLTNGDFGFVKIDIAPRDTDRFRKSFARPSARWIGIQSSGFDGDFGGIYAGPSPYCWREFRRTPEGVWLLNPSIELGETLDIHFWQTRL